MRFLLQSSIADFSAHAPLNLKAVFLLAVLALCATLTNKSGKGSRPVKESTPWTRIRHTLIGRPISSRKAHEEKLGVFIGLPVFSSDALSSVAYATEAVLAVLILKSATQINIAWPITLAICLLIVIVGISYQQTINAYPNGGGSYIVATENLGKFPGLVAGASLLLDYILTVSVSIAAGVAAIVSAFPAVHPFLTPIAVVCIMFVAWANLRGAKESGAVFAIPTYTFVLLIMLMLVFGVIKTLGVGTTPNVISDHGVIGSEAAYPLIFIILRSFSAGCTALTGIEAVSNGVPAFRDPAPKNAAKTLRLMATLLVTMFLGIGFVALRLPEITLYSTHNSEYSTLVSQIAAFTFGQNSFLFYAIQLATAAILILAANTAFADFPRLARLLSIDGFLPRNLIRQGDRLVFQNGIIVLAAASIALVWYFHGELDMLLPLYAVGVFTAFTLSQTGMVVHWLQDKSSGWVPKIIVNGIGALVTGVVAIIILATKFSEGAWIILVLVTLLIGVFLAINRRYRSISRQLKPADIGIPHVRDHTVLVLVPRVHQGTLNAIAYAEKLGGHRRAIHVTIEQKTPEDLIKDWDKFNIEMPLVVLQSPYRSLTGPIFDYVDEMLAENANQLITVIVPEAYSVKPWHRLLHESVALQLKLALGTRKNVVVSSVRYFLD